MFKPRDYDTAQAATGEFVSAQLTPGGHGVLILKAEAVTLDRDGTKVPQIHVYFDIAEGSEYDNYFKQKYEASKKFRPDTAKWQGIFRQNVYAQDGESTNPYFKGLITSIENSNPMYKWTWDEHTLKGKKLGMVFRERDFEVPSTGEIKTTVEAAWACDWDAYESMPVPKKKELVKKTPAFPQQMTETQDDDLPF